MACDCPAWFKCKYYLRLRFNLLGRNINPYRADHDYCRF